MTIQKTTKRGPGRPAKFSSAEELAEKIEKYFTEQCRSIPMTDEDGHVLTTKAGKPVIEYNPPTMAGLALYIGFANTRSMYDYRKNEKFSHAINCAITRMEDYAEKQLMVGQASGAIFWLKNHGWCEKVEPDKTGETPPSLADLGIVKEDIVALAKQFKQK